MLCYCVFQCKLPDGRVFLPILDLLRKVGRDVRSLQSVVADEDERCEELSKPPPHAQLPEDGYDDVPVHDGRYLKF